MRKGKIEGIKLNRIAEVRLQTNRSQSKLADEVGMTKIQLSKYENGTATPRPDLLLKIARTLNVKVDDIYQFDV